jgi:hypothetical protein
MVAPPRPSQKVARLDPSPYALRYREQAGFVPQVPGFASELRCNGRSGTSQGEAAPAWWPNAQICTTIWTRSSRNAAAVPATLASFVENPRHD